VIIVNGAGGIVSAGALLRDAGSIWRILAMRQRLALLVAVLGPVCHFYQAAASMATGLLYLRRSDTPKQETRELRASVDEADARNAPVSPRPIGASSR